VRSLVAFFGDTASAPEDLLFAIAPSSVPWACGRFLAVGVLYASRVALTLAGRALDF